MSTQELIVTPTSFNPATGKWEDGFPTQVTFDPQRNTIFAEISSLQVHTSASVIFLRPENQVVEWGFSPLTYKRDADGDVTEFIYSGAGNKEVGGPAQLVAWND